MVLASGRKAPRAREISQKKKVKGGAGKMKGSKRHSRGKTGYLKQIQKREREQESAKAGGSMSLSPIMT